MTTVKVIGAGLAGSEAAYQLAQRGIHVDLYEMRPGKASPAHHTDMFGELVCSNSLKSLDGSSAAGTLKFELAALGSMMIREAVKASVPAGKALAVDRSIFAANVTEILKSHPNITVIEEELTEIPQGPAIVATGPLTSDALALDIQRRLGVDFLSFYDAAAPIVSSESIDTSKIFAQSRYGKGEGADYLNAPFEKEEYERFISELVEAERVILKDFERKELFSACQPVEEIARTGIDALRFGPLKPVGLSDPNTGKRPWAVVQLRAENASCEAYNLVGFQTNLRFGEQDRVFRMIPGLENADFVRYGVMHRNTFIDSPKALGRFFEIPSDSMVVFAGQLTGTEGYCEAIASGLLAALSLYARINGIEMPSMPKETFFGSLVDYATDPETERYQPMHVNCGLMPALQKKVKKKRERYAEYTKRARESVFAYREELQALGIIEDVSIDIPELISMYIEEGAE